MHCANAIRLHVAAHWFESHRTSTRNRTLSILNKGTARSAALAPVVHGTLHTVRILTAHRLVFLRAGGGRSLALSPVENLPLLTHLTVALVCRSALSSVAKAAAHGGKLVTAGAA